MCNIYEAFSVPYLWFLTDVLRGGLAGHGCNITSKKSKSRFRQYFHALSLPLTSFMVHAFVFYDIRCRLMPSKGRTIVGPMPFSGTTVKDDDPGRFILVAVVARIGSDMKNRKKCFHFLSSVTPESITYNTPGAKKEIPFKSPESLLRRLRGT